METLIEPRRSDNAAGSEWLYTDEHLLAGWNPPYPTVSELFADSEACPVIFSLVAKTLRNQRFQEMLSLWQSLGRPEIAWPEPEQSVPQLARQR